MRLPAPPPLDNLRCSQMGQPTMASDAPVNPYAGRHAAKDALRHRVWASLTAAGVNVGPVWGRIPNFAGADLAAWHLAQLPHWQAARIVKCNPDPAQIPVRLRALHDGKLVYAPVPALVQDFPFYRLDPAELARNGVAFELAATADGAALHGTPIAFEDMQRIDIAVVGCVAVTRRGGRTGKGAGFADIELGIFRELGIVDAQTPIVTTVHSLQLVDDSDIVMLDHDNPLTAIATPAELIATGSTYRVPSGMLWDSVQPDQFDEIPFLRRMRERLQGALP
jgi:5-formyltetrahydrofolate cyclo-ligase